jgi:hypothetical protein
MATGLQIRRGTAAQNEIYLGLEGEITVDTDSWSLRIHDGVTRGGHLLGSQAARVTSVGLDASSLGLQTYNSPVVTNGVMRLSGVVNVQSGGTGTSTPSMKATGPLVITGSWPNQTVSFDGILSQKYGGTGVEYPALVAGKDITIDGAWPNHTISYSGHDLTAGQNISLVNKKVSLTGLVPVANGGTGTNNPNPTGISPILVTGDWPNSVISLTGVIPVANGGTGTPSPRIVAGDTNITVVGDWPNQVLSLNKTISVNTITPANFATSYPSIQFDSQDKSVTINADKINFVYNNGSSRDIFSQTVSSVQAQHGLLVAYSTMINSITATASGTGYGEVFMDRSIVDTDNGLSGSVYKPIKSGYYRVQATVLLDLSTVVVGQTIYLQILQNGTEAFTVQETILYATTSTSTKSMQVSGILRMDGIYDKISIQLGTSTSHISYVVGVENTYLTVTLI